MSFYDAIRVGASGAGDFEVERSLRFNTSDVAYLNRTIGTPTNNKIFTFSCWLKISKLDGDGKSIFLTQGSGQNGADQILTLKNDNKLFFQGSDSGIYGRWESTRLLRDTSAWYHIVVKVDTTASSNGVTFYVNNEVVAGTWVTTLSQNQAFSGSANGATQHVGKGLSSYPSQQAFGGYLAEINFVDGQAYDPSYFGETNPITGQWIPIDTSGLTYGTNGFRLKFADNSGTTATTLGKDSSGNGNNFTPNNFGTGDAVKDSPTNNFCTLNPLNQNKNRGQASFAEGNLRMTSTSGNRGFTTGTIKAQGKIYFEVLNKSNSGFVGIADITGSNHQSLDFYNGTPRIDGSAGSNTGQFSSGDIMGVKVDIDAKSIEFFRNNSSVYSATYTTDVEYFPFIEDPSGGRSTDAIANFGQDSSFVGEKTAQGNTDANGKGDFYYAPPSGFLALCSANLPDPTILLPNKHFDTTLFTGNETARSFSLDFGADWIWLKERSAGGSHRLFDSVRGANNLLISSQTTVELVRNNEVPSFSSTGFNIGNATTVNENSVTNVAWTWNAGESTVTNNDGSISSQVRANTTAGFSIVSYTGTGSTATVGHGLGVAPDVLIVKNRDDTNSWNVYHVGNAGSTPAEDFVIYLNQTSAKVNQSSNWNDTAPTSSVFTVGSSNGSNGSSDDMIAYCFSEVAGYSKFGSYTGNGNNDGSYVACGFAPAWIMVKRIDSTGNWGINDVKRDLNTTYGNDASLYANTNGAETTSSSLNVDFLSNGFKLRSDNSSYNGSGGTYIYLAFAESPFKNARAR